VGGVTADPGGGKAEQADKIVDAALKPIDLIDREVKLEGHVRPVAREPPSGATASSSASYLGVGRAQCNTLVNRQEVSAPPMMPR
jgi:hypothetical protein